MAISWDTLNLDTLKAEMNTTVAKLTFEAAKLINAADPATTVNTLNNALSVLATVRDDTIMPVQLVNDIVNTAINMGNGIAVANKHEWNTGATGSASVLIEMGEDGTQALASVQSANELIYVLVGKKSNYQLNGDYVLAPLHDRAILPLKIKTVDSIEAAYGVFENPNNVLYIVQAPLAEGAIPDMTSSDWTSTVLPRANIIGWLAKNGEMQVLIDNFLEAALVSRKTLVDKINNIEYTYSADVINEVG